MRSFAKNRDAANRDLGLRILIVAVLIAMMAIAYILLASPSPTSKSVSYGVAPDLTLPRVGGGTLTLREYYGRSNVLLFFSEGLSCDPCLREIRNLDKDYERFRSLNVVVVLITTDPLTGLTRWTEENKIANLVVLSDPGLQVSKAYGVLGSDVSRMPWVKAGHTFILVHISGTVRWRQDYGPSVMFVANEEILARVREAISH